MSDTDTTPRTDDPHVLVGIDNVRRFITAGNAVFTMRNADTGNRVTYKVIAIKDEHGEKTGDYRVQAFTGSDNSNRGHYTDLGVIENGQFKTNDLISAAQAAMRRARSEGDETTRHFAGLCIFYLRRNDIADWRLSRLHTLLDNWDIPVTTLDTSDMKAKVFPWLWQKYVDPVRNLPSQIEVWHEGRCGACGRRLTVPESIANGLGPVCAGHVHT